MGHPSEVPPPRRDDSGIKVVRLIVVLLFAITLFVAIIAAITVRGPDVMILQALASWVVQVLGGFIALVAGLGLLLAGLSGGSLHRLLALLPALLAGLLLMQVHWAVALALGGIAITHLVITGLAVGKQSDPNTPAE
jgi:hypothetical protein